MSQVQRLQFTIEGHTLTLLAVDGTEVTPMDVASISLQAGERYDFRLCADQKRFPWSNGDFSIIAEAPETCTFEAKLKYKGILGENAAAKLHQKPSLPHLDLGTWDSHLVVTPLEAPPLLKQQADAAFNLSLGELTDGSMFLHTEEMPWTMPSTPLLMTKGSECADNVPVINIPESASDVELTISNTLMDAHVVHLHGPRFQVMSSSRAGENPLPSSAPLLRD